MVKKRGMKSGSVCYSPGEANILRQFDRNIQKITGQWKPVHRKLSRTGTVTASASRPKKTTRKKKEAVVTITEADLGLKKSKPTKKEQVIAARLSKKKGVVTEKDIVEAEKDMTKAEAAGLAMLPGSRAEKVKYINKKLSKTQINRLMAIPGIGSIPGSRATKEAFVAEKVLSDLEKEIIKST